MAALRYCKFLLDQVFTGVRNDFSSQLHKFMAHLTDAQHKTVGHTVLYVPNEGFRMADNLAHLDKDLVQRLEGKKIPLSTVNQNVVVS